MVLHKSYCYKQLHSCCPMDVWAYYFANTLPCTSPGIYLWPIPNIFCCWPTIVFPAKNDLLTRLNRKTISICLVSGALFFQYIQWRNRPTCEAVRTEYHACHGTAVTLRCKVKNVKSCVWKCPNSNEKKEGTIKDGQCLLEIQYMKEEFEGGYIFEASGCTSEPIVLRILSPIEKQVFEHDTVILENPPQEKKFKWTYLHKGANREFEEEPIETQNTSSLVITDFRKENEGTYICRDKGTDEQLIAYRLTTKYRLKVSLMFSATPANEDLRKKLICDTQQLLKNEPTYHVAIQPTEKHTDVAEPGTMNAVAYFIKERNKTEYEEMRSRSDDPSTVFMLFVTGDRGLPDLPFDRKQIAIRYTDYGNNVKCAFYDEGQKVAWNKLLKEFTGN